MKLSIIIPCYNVIEYIDDCLDSLTCDLESNAVEVIWVNDGPLDFSDIYVKRKYSHLENLKIVDQKNKGLSGARNTGLQHASGEYVVFLDSDDLVTNGAVKKILLCIENTEADLVIVDYDRYWREGQYERMPSIKGIKHCCLTKSQDHSLIKSVFDYGECYVWRYIIKREVLKKNRFEFPEGKCFEDIASIPFIFKACQTFFYLPISFVKYRQRVGSITKVYSEKNIRDLSKATVYDNPFIEQISNEERLSLSAFALRVFMWATQDALKAGSFHLNAEIWDNCNRAMYVDESKALAYIKRIHPNDYKKIRCLRFTKMLYVLLFKVYSVKCLRTIILLMAKVIR